MKCLMHAFAVFCLLGVAALCAEPPALVKPTSGVPQSATPRAVCTFASIGLYWTPAGSAEKKPCRVRYRPAGEPTWREALPLWFDQRIGEYRGSIVQLQSGRTYEVRLELGGGGPSAELKAATWSETFPIARTVHVDDMTGRTLTADQSGSAAGYVLYTHRPGAATATIDAADKVNQCVEVKASYVILRGLTLRSPKIHGIVLGQGAHDVVIEGCDISGWGRISADGWGEDYDSAIYSKYRELTRVIIERNHMHHPRSNSNSWQQQREFQYGKYAPTKHPMGPQAICFFESAGNHVFRYNEFTTDENHFCNDIFGGGANRSLRGFPGGDSDVYGNHLEGCWDDGLEMEGSGCNVRVWGNYIDRTMVKIAIAGLSVGPIYIFRNVAGVSRFGHTSWSGEPFLKMGGAPLTGGGRAYVFHNTILQPPGPPEARGTIGCAEGLNQSGGPELLSVVSRNNILHVRHKDGHSIREWSKEPDYDYDLISGKVVSAGKQESHGVVGIPVYAANRPAGDFSLAPGSPGFDAGVPIPNFNDGFQGQAPDMGACEAGAAPPEFGVNAYVEVHDHSMANAAAAPWSRPVQLSGHGAIGSPGGTHPLAFDKTAYAAWTQHGVIHLSTSDDGGVTWGHAARIMAKGTALYPCSLELSGPVLHLVWPDTRHLDLAEPYYKRSTDRGKTWTDEVRLSPGTDLFRIGTAVSGSAVHVVWFNRHLLEKVPAGDQTWTWTWGEVYYCRSTDGGVKWEKAIRLTQPDSTASRPVVAASGKFVHVAWLDNRDARQKPGWDWEIYYKRSTDGGATWGPDVRMSRNEWHSRHPQIMTSGGDRVCCVWEDGAIWDGKTSSGWSGDGALYAAVSNDNGQTWRPAQRITTVNSPNGRATHAKSFAAGSRLLVGWTDAVEGGIHQPIRAEAAYFAMSTDGGLTWSRAERLAGGLPGEWAVNAVAGDDSRAIALLSRGDTIHVSVRQSSTTEPTEP